jgi:vacuole morphology and inheritance protein 14
VARYLEVIVPPVLACFTDQDARVRYYACESMYNISKVAKGEILLFFNLVFDALCKVSSGRVSCLSTPLNIYSLQATLNCP